MIPSSSKSNARALHLCAALAASALVGSCEGKATALRFPKDASVEGARPGFYAIDLNPFRQLDLVVMIDNSPSMAPKQQKLRDNFYRLIAALENPIDGGLPDLRVAIIDSDLGTGGAYSAGSCGPKQLADGTTSVYGDMGRFQMIGARACGVTDSNALWLEYRDRQPINYVGDINTVFACLGGNLGTVGCGEEHPLQAFELALVTPNVGNDRQRSMLRPNANLGLVFLTDEDDCSAAFNDGMFGDKPELHGESSSLRCVTRSAACGGKNLTQSPPGYPTDAPFEAPLSTCVARNDACPSAFDKTKGSTDTSLPTSCSPFASVKRIVDEIKALKAKPAEQLFVVGIFGWPSAERDLATAAYKIAPVPNPNTADTSHPQIFDAWPVCYDPAHQPTDPDPATGFDWAAAGWGALAGLRLAEFVDAFGSNGLKFSICEPDFSSSMQLIGHGMARQMQNLCVPRGITGFSTCVGSYLVPDSAGNQIRDPTLVPTCDPQAVVPPCYSLEANADYCPADSLYVRLERGAESAEPFKPGTKLEIRCE
jgi:hypothetical protein